MHEYEYFMEEKCQSIGLNALKVQTYGWCGFMEECRSGNAGGAGRDGKTLEMEWQGHR